MSAQSTTEGELRDASILNFQWKINNFTECVDGKKVLISPISHKKWSLRLYTDGILEDSKGYYSLYLHNTTNDEIETTVKIFLEDSKKTFKKFEFKHKFKKNEQWGYSQFIKQSILMDPVNQILINDALVIKCIVYENCSNLAPFEEDTKKDEAKLAVQLTSRVAEFDLFEQFLLNAAYCDVTFIVNGTEIPAHKTILMARSSVFEAMFASDETEEERTDNKVNVKDITSDVFIELLRFIYAAKVKDIEKVAKHLLIAAEKYKVEGLKAECGDFLSKNLSIENALDYLNLADTCNCLTLKTEAIKFVAKHMKDIISKPEYESLKNLNVNVISELIRNIVQNNEE